MTIREMTEGRKTAYRLQGNILYLGEKDEVAINLQERQKDVAVRIDVYPAGSLLREGSGAHYAANILLPPRRYADTARQEIGINGQPITVTIKEALPLDIDAVILQLWGIPEIKIEGGI